jgi:hypothetical protein
MITFGIITHGLSNDLLSQALQSIEQFAPHNEVIVVGGEYIYGVNHVPFDDDERPGWITRKKNLITTYANCDNVVYMHDYLALCPGWQEGFDSFGDDWDICMSAIENVDGSRYHDWCLWDDPRVSGGGLIVENWCPNGIKKTGGAALYPYDQPQCEHMYIPGAYWIAKRQFMLDNPLDEEILHCQGEDVEWSYRIRDKMRYCMNPQTKVRLLRNKPLAMGTFHV